MSLTMTKEEREAFLAEVHVAVISIPETGRGPLSVPVWYDYQPEVGFSVWIGSSSRKARLIQQAGRFSLCVQQETRPYRYVSAEGPVLSMEPIDLERDLRPLVYRYFGRQEGDRFLEQLGGETAGTGDILVRMKPERWLSEDYAKQ